MRGLIRIVVATAAAVALFAPAAAQAGGELPALGWSPITSSDTYDYGAVVPGASASQTFTLTNSGGSGTGMITVTLSDSAAFSMTADACTGTGLGPNRSCAVTVEYAPLDAGQRGTATLEAIGKRISAYTSITLTGSGAGGSPDVSLSPATFTGTSINGTKSYSYDFGSVSSASQTFTVTNAGTGTTGDLSLVGCCVPGFVLSNDTCGGNALVPSGTCTFDLTFTAPSGCASGDEFPTGVAVLDADSLALYISLQVQAECP